MTDKVDVKLPSPGSSEGDGGLVRGSLDCSEKAVAIAHEDQKHSALSQSWTDLENLRKTLIDIKKLKVKVQEKQTAVLTAKQKRRKAAQKTILAMEKELQELQDKLRTEQVQHQQQVEELERTFCKEKQKLEV